MKHIYLIYTIIFSILISQEFNPGPYGTTPFEIAGPFTVMDLNRPTLGDPNFDEEININDVIILVHYILETGNDLDFEQQQISDINNDGSINVLDIVSLVGIILGD